MKESTGMLNATVVVVIAVGVFMAFFYYTLWPLIKRNYSMNADCSRAICDQCPEDDNGKRNCEMVKCHLKGDDPNDPDKTFECVWKG